MTQSYMETVSKNSALHVTVGNYFNVVFFLFKKNNMFLGKMQISQKQKSS